MVDKNSSIGAASKQTLVEEGTHFKGSLSSTCPVVVRGKIEGEVAAPSLNVSPSGAVHGTVKVAELRSAGELLGDFEADTVTLSGVVKDNTVLRAKSLEVKLTVATGKMQMVFGNCTLAVGEPITKEEAVRAATHVAAIGTSVRPPAKGDAKDGDVTGAPNPGELPAQTSKKSP